MMLNPQQMAAVKYIDGPLLVLAGAGSGKTRVITQKIAYLVEECGYKASSVVAVTFTNKAANEMSTRVASSLPVTKRRGLKIATFHTLGLTIIKKELKHCGLRTGFSIFDSEDCQRILKGLLPINKANEKDYLFQIQQQISRWKNDLMTIKEVESLVSTIPVVQDALAIYARYQQALKAYNAVDFDDLIKIPVDLLITDADIRERWQNKIRHLLIDEYQDSNSSQYTLIKLLAGIGARFTVVGDDDQSIYAWRGAKPENLAQLQRDFPQLKIIKLEQNYRSTHTILHVANTLIANNPHLFEKKLWSKVGQGECLRILSCKDEQDEAEQVIADIISQKLRLRKNYEDFAILYRGNHQARIFEKILRHHGINYYLSGGQSWFAKAEVKDMFAYLKLLCNESDDPSFLRAINAPKRGIGDVTLEVLGNYAQSRNQSLFQCADHLALVSKLAEKPRMALVAFKRGIVEIKQKLLTHAVVEVIKELVEISGYEAYCYEQCDNPTKAQKRMENVWELIDWIGRLLEKNPAHSLMDVVNKLILIDILEQSDENVPDAVQLMTLHASKGLEFKYVYLVGMEEELLPHRVSIDENQIEEERRLAYVGITRAQEGLCLTLAQQRRRGGELQNCQPSRFIEELPQNVIEWYGKTSERNEEKSKNVAKQHLAGLKNLLGS